MPEVLLLSILHHLHPCQLLPWCPSRHGARRLSTLGLSNPWRCCWCVQLTCETHQPAGDTASCCPSGGFQKPAPGLALSLQKLIKVTVVSAFKFRAVRSCSVSACEVKAVLPPMRDRALVYKLCLSVLSDNQHSRCTNESRGDGSWGQALAAGVRTWVQIPWTHVKTRYSRRLVYNLRARWKAGDRIPRCFGAG